jgi:hypothetical protein
MSKINETNYPRRTQANYEDTDMLVIQKAGGNTYTTRIEDLREDCQETLAPALDTMRENLATIEGSTASKAYAKGDFLVFGGRLCKAKTSIASGATLVLDTNIELDSVGDELSSISSDLTVQDISNQTTLNNDVVQSCGTKRVLKYGKHVQVYLGNVIFKTQGNTKIILTGLPRAIEQMGCVPTGLDAAKTAELFAAGTCAWLGSNSTTLNAHIGATYTYNHWFYLTYLCQ